MSRHLHLNVRTLDFSDFYTQYFLVNSFSLFPNRGSIKFRYKKLIWNSSMKLSNSLSYIEHLCASLYIVIRAVNLPPIWYSDLVLDDGPTENDHQHGACSSKGPRVEAPSEVQFEMTYQLEHCKLYIQSPMRIVSNRNYVAKKMWPIIKVS